MKKENNLRFVKAVQWLKNSKNIQFRTVYEKLDMGRGRWDAIKRNLSNVNEFEIENLKKNYPDTSRFFEDSYILEEPTTPYKIDITQKYIASLEQINADLSEKVAELKKQMTAKEADAEYLRLLRQILEKLNDNR